jgi:hypothetical protein
MSAPRIAVPDTLAARIAVCVLLGAVTFCATFAGFGVAVKAATVGPAEALASLVRALTDFTAMDLLRLAGLATALNLIGCAPVYLGPPNAPARPVWLVVYAMLAALAVAGYLWIEAWAWFGPRAPPPPLFVLAFATAALAAALACQFFLSIATNHRSNP